MAHSQSRVADLDSVNDRWKSVRNSFLILLCTDDILERLNIQNAEILIHYYMPDQSKYNFGYRLSFAMDHFHQRSSESDKPESHLLLTKKFHSSLLTVVRLMRRFGQKVPEDMETDALLAYYNKEVRKRDQQLCDKLKVSIFT